MQSTSSMEMLNRGSNATADHSRWKNLYQVAFVAALLALSANLLDVILGFGETDITTYGSMSAIEWFALFEDNGFKGLYVLGILNIVYIMSMIPVYFAIVVVHRHANWVYAALSMSIFFIGAAIYLSNNAAIPMFVLADKYAVATADEARASIAAAGEAVLAVGEDFTPGSFLAMLLQTIAAIAVSVVMLRGGIFGNVAAWIGIVGFTFLSIFTILATLAPSLYAIAFYFFAMIGDLLALTWFGLVALKFFKLMQMGN